MSNSNEHLDRKGLEYSIASKLNDWVKNAAWQQGYYDCSAGIHTMPLAEQGNTAANLSLADGDIVYVPREYLANIALEARRISEIASAIIGVEYAAILFESFTKALTHAPDRPGVPATVVNTR